MDSKTNNAPLIVGGIIVLAVLALGAYAFMQKDAPVSKGEMMQKEEETMAGKEEDMVKGEEGMTEKDDTMMHKGSYEAYAPEKLAMAETGDVVLFFHASWCPSCRGLSADIEKNLAAIPSGVSILKVDYDTETELKKKYSITSQHTLVQVAADGTLIKKWSGSPTLTSLVSQIN